MPDASPFIFTAVGTVWEQGWSRTRWEHIVSHELGHNLDGVTFAHPTPSVIQAQDPGETLADAYAYGNYSNMKANESLDEGYIPFHLRVLQEAGWYPPPLQVTQNLRDVQLYDIRGPQGGTSYRVDLDPLPHGSVDVEQYFLIAFHGGVAEDAELNQEVPPLPLYRSQGLAVWHMRDVPIGSVGSGGYYNVQRRWDLELSSGRYSDNSPWPGTWTLPDPGGKDSSDSLDYWLGWGAPVPDSDAVKDYVLIDGGPRDFFNLRPSNPGLATPEFSYRTNPHTFGYDPSGQYNGFRTREDQDVQNSIYVEVKEDNGDHLIVDILLAPYEDVLSPNGGEALLVGEPVEITWDQHRTWTFDATPQLVIDEVDIEYSTDGGTNWSTLVQGYSNAAPNTGTYLWTPGVGDVAEDGTIRITYHNIYSTEVGSDTSDMVFAVKDYKLSYSDRSGDTHQVIGSFTGEPYDAVAFDYNGDGRQDLLVSDSDGLGELFRNDIGQAGSEDVPRFARTTTGEFVAADRPDGLRGLAVADLDQDGDLDVFGAAKTDGGQGYAPRLYQFETSANEDATDIAPATGSGGTDLATLANNSWSGAWADVNHDGKMDLYVGRAGTMSGSPSTPIDDLLMKNTGTGTFKDISASALINSTQLATTSVSWGAMGHDPHLELFVGDAGTTGSQLYRVKEYLAGGSPVFESITSALPDITPNDYSSVCRSSWVDMDSDGFLDLVVCRTSATGNNALVLWYDAASESGGEAGPESGGPVPMSVENL